MILYDNGRCLSGGGGKVGLTLVKWCAKNCACLSVRGVHATLASIKVIVLYVSHVMLRV